MQRGLEPRRFHRSFCRDIDASDPQTPDPFTKRNLGDADEERTEDAPSTVLADRSAVPDVAFADAWADLELKLTYPLGSRGKPSVTRDCTIADDGKATAASRESRSDEVGFVAHRGFDEVRASGVDLLDIKKRRTCRRQVRRPESASDWWV